ncbi:S-adenosyl-L-methionine-dependent methyltransferase [Glomus cerebriforme]|uniref:tRNA (adenine(58)-N(1))-methyltransferase catalytic subunit TRM61 n=1 Tax=Glomus cerebriforme TaxID=658196 RepID=A0A397T221_9GLOM|nr:S-adenosyl-L-methionine-dependent methyltransferase [Glomus cerebriforme]
MMMICRKSNSKIYQNVRTIVDTTKIIIEKFDKTKFFEGDTVVLRDTTKKIKGPRISLIGPLKKGSKTENYSGIIYHDSIIGKSIRSIVKTNKEKSFTLHFPTLDEYVLKISRRTTPIYPKDANTIVALLDLYPYSRILEAGTGNGSLTLYLARAIYPTGHIHTIDINADSIRKAQKNIEQYFRGIYYNNITFSTGSCSDVLNSLPENTEKYDGVVLDMPEPWLELSTITPKLKLDGFMICYLPNITQILNLIKFIRENKFKLATIQVLEVQWRPWEVRATVIRSKMDENIAFSVNKLVMDNKIPEKALAYVCRPAHMPSSHTAFLIQLKKIEEDSCEKVDVQNFDDTEESEYSKNSEDSDRSNDFNDFSGSSK